jgi:hypothetical protein
MDLLAQRGRRVSIEELNTGRLLAHASAQARERRLDEVLIVDVDSHHYENECYGEFLPYIENEVLRQLVLAGQAKGRQTLMPSQVSFQDMGGRITRYPMRSSEKTAGGTIRDVELGQRWMDAMSVDYACLFPTMLLAACILRSRWRSSCASPTTAGSPSMRCRRRRAASIPCCACRFRIPTRRCARSRPSAAASM